MSLQARMTRDDPRLYDPNRDVAHCFKYVVMEVEKRTLEQCWPPLHSYLLQAHGVTEAAVGEAGAAFTRFVSGACERPKESMPQLLERSGWFAVPQPAQIAYMAYLGTVMSGIFFHGARMATIGGKGPCSDMADLVAAGRESSRLLRLSRGQRRRQRWAYKVREVWRVLTGRSCV